MSKVKKLLQQEQDSWVRSALDRVVDKWEGRANLQESTFTGPHGLVNDVEEVNAQAVQQVTSTVLHEIKPIVTDIAMALNIDLGLECAGSASNKAVERLSEFLDTIQRLHEAASAPRFTEFDIQELVKDEIAMGGYKDAQAIATRTEPAIATGDPALLRLAIQNALRNAVEASEPVGGPQVLVNYAVNQKDAWISVLDEGVGLPESHESLYAPGNSMKSKETHFGWGLTIALQAMQSLGGSISLSPRKHGGTICKISWAIINNPEESTQ